MVQKGFPITETPNELTKNIDIADSVGIVRILRQTDSQIFNGYSTYPGLNDVEILDKIQVAIEKTATVLKNKQNRAIVISGAGTSGRLAMFIARTFNHLLAQANYPPIFSYLMAGGDKALIRAQEGAEDNPKQAVQDLISVIQHANQVAYFGITCGLSAPYIAGQLDYTAYKKNIFSVLVGFNSAESARNVPVENWNKTFLEIVHKIQQKNNCLILNPIIGPEPVTGSTRMKSGTATKLLLELIFTLAVQESGVVKKTYRRSLTDQIRTLIQQYETIRIETYRELASIAQVVALAGNALRNKRHLYYLGSAPLGILGIIDASECPPTFGAEFDDVNGFIKQGWKGLLDSGIDLSAVGPQYLIGIDDFVNHKLAYLSKNDLVVYLGEQTIPASFLNLLKQSKKRGAYTSAVLVNRKKKKSAGIDVLVQPQLSQLTLLCNHTAFGEIAMKWILNAITTGGYILAGKVYQNRMVDLKISNNKLYYRTINIIADIMQVSKETATESMLKSIYETNRLTQEQQTFPISAHIAAATGKTKVVPKALLLATGKYNLQQAISALKTEPIVRNIIMKQQNKSEIL